MDITDINDNNSSLRKKKAALLKAIADWVANDQSLPIPESQRKAWCNIIGRDDLIEMILDKSDPSRS